MKTRILIGTALVIVVTALLGLDAWRGARTCGSLLIIGLTLLGWYEMATLTGMTSAEKGGGRFLTLVSALALGYFALLNLWFAAGEPPGFSPFEPGRYGESVLLGLTVFFLLSVAAVVRRDDHERSLWMVLASLLSVILLGLFFSFCLVLYHRPEGVLMGLVFFLGVKGNDIVAYFVGRSLGRVRFLKVSPKKTLEGCSAAVVFSVLFFVTADWVWPGRFFPWPWAIGAGIILSITTQMGDLCESLVKRAFRVKDSAGLLPEFGGVLDMVDSMLFSGVVFWFLLETLR